MLLEYGKCKISINTDKGKYAMDDYSASGKTRLYSILNTGVAALILSDVAIFTFVEFADITDNVCLALASNKYNLIFLDRFDKYFNDKIAKAINESKVPYIFMDLKDTERLNKVEVDYCGIELLGPYEVEIYD